ncbi:hypothetical protein ASG80_18740 [Agromyces sp. Soil535]|nr:hypothetical protein ASG80_18740 [Agromyces sp. Soil535]
MEAHVTSVSWIPSESITSGMRSAFDRGMTHYDAPPPDVLGSLEDLRVRDRFRFANRHEAWAEFADDGTVVDHGYAGQLVMGSSTVRLGPYSFTAAGVSMPTLRPDPVVGDGTITFLQTAGGRTGMPLPRANAHPPFIHLTPPLVWTTLSLTLSADGSSHFELSGASDFPRHWVYDEQDRLALKAGVATWDHWLGQGSWRDTPWGDADSAVVVTAAETELERALSGVIMRGAEPPHIRSLEAGEVLFAQGTPGDTLSLVLDGVVAIDVDGVGCGELGPGAVLGERAILTDGMRTATVTALTGVRVAEVPASAVDRAALEELTQIHHREESASQAPVA